MEAMRCDRILGWNFLLLGQECLSIAAQHVDSFHSRNTVDTCETHVQNILETRLSSLPAVDYRAGADKHFWTYSENVSVAFVELSERCRM